MFLAIVLRQTMYNHLNVTYGHLGVAIDFDGYLNHFHVLCKSVISFEEKNMSVYVKSVFSRLISVLDTNRYVQD